MVICKNKYGKFIGVYYGRPHFGTVDLCVLAEASFGYVLISPDIDGNRGCHASMYFDKEIITLISPKMKNNKFLLTRLNNVVKLIKSVGYYTYNLRITRDDTFNKFMNSLGVTYNGWV